MAKQWAIQSVPGRTPDGISNNDEKNGSIPENSFRFCRYRDFAFQGVIFRRKQTTLRWKPLKTRQVVHQNGRFLVFGSREEAGKCKSRLRQTKSVYGS